MNAKRLLKPGWWELLCKGGIALMLGMEVIQGKERGSKKEVNFAVKYKATCSKKVPSFSPPVSRK